MNCSLQRFKIDAATVLIYPTINEMSCAVAAQAAAILKDAISQRGSARMIIGTGTSQEEFIRALARTPGVEWRQVEVFHMDEYLGMRASDPASFVRWVKTNFGDIVHPGKVYYMNGGALDVEEECRRYGSLLCSGPINLSCLGFGENGHLAFNDPHVADFSDPVPVKRVELDKHCRMQQVGEGHFPNLEAVPREAITITCPILVGAEHVICCVPERRKAEAVRAALEGPVSPTCPASLVRTHRGALVFLDEEAASLLTRKRAQIG